MVENLSAQNTNIKIICSSLTKTLFFVGFRPQTYSRHGLNLLLKLLHLVAFVAVGKLEEHLITSLGLVVDVVKVAITSDSSCEHHVFSHDRLSLRVDGTQVSVFEDTNDVGFSGFLQRNDSLALEAQVGVKLLGDVLDESLERSAGNNGIN